MKNQWRVVLGIVLILLIVLFAVANNMTVPVNFGFAKISGPLILIIIGSAFIGAIIVSLVSTSAIMQQKKQIKQLKKELNSFETENEKKLAQQREVLEREYANKLAEYSQSSGEESLYVNSAENEQQE